MLSTSCRMALLAAGSMLAIAGAAAQVVPGAPPPAPAGAPSPAIPSSADPVVMPAGRGKMIERLPIYTPSFPYGADAPTAARPAAEAVTTLRDAIVLAYWNSPRLLAQRATLRATDNRYPIARSAYGPQVTIQGVEGYQRDRTEIAAGQYRPLQGFSTTAALILNQPVYTFGRLRSAENVALGQIALGRDTLRLIEAETVLNAVSSYIAVRRDTLSVQVAEENLALLTRQYGDSAERFRVREITSTDLQQIETRVEFGRAQLLQAQGQLGVSRSQFLQNVGGVPGALTDPVPLPIGSPTLDQAYAYAEANSAVLRAAHSREKISRAGIDAARAEQGPRVDLRGTGNYGTTSPYSNDLRNTTITGQAVVSLPLIDSGLRRAQLREAKEANDSDWRLIDAALRDTHQAVAGSWNQLTAARASLVHYQQASDAAQRAYDGALIQEKAGARTTLDVLDLARDLLSVRTNFIVAEANEYLARANLLAAMGRLEAPLLVPDIATYDPAAYFDKVKRSGDIPLLTDSLAPLDAITTRDTRMDRPIRDPAGPLVTEGQVPLTTDVPPRPDTPRPGAPASGAAPR